MEILIALLLLLSPAVFAAEQTSGSAETSPAVENIVVHDLFLLNHPLGPMLSVKFRPAKEGSAEASDDGVLFPEPEIKVSRDEVQVTLAHCEMDSALKKRLKATPLQLTLENAWVLKGILGEAPDACALTLLTPVGFFKFSKKLPEEKGTVLFQGFFTANDEKISGFEGQYWRALSQPDSQADLRAAARGMATLAHHTYVKHFFLSGLKDGQFSQVLSLASGLCLAVRHEFFPELQKLNLVEQLTGTPDEAWMKTCIKTLEIFYNLDPQLEPERKSQGLDGVNTMQLKDVETYLFLGGRQGQWVENYIRNMPVDLNQTEKNRRFVLLALKARQKSAFSDVVAWGEQATLGKKAKPLTFEFVRVAPQGEDADVVRTERFTVNAISLEFMKAEALSRMKKDAEAKAIYEALAKSPPRTMYDHVEGGEKFFALPAATYAQSLLALSDYKLGEKSLACQAWVDLAWKNANSLFSGFEFEESLCKYNLQFVQDYCPKELGAIKDREARFLKAPAACLAAWKKVFRPDSSTK